MATRRIGNATINFTPTQNQTQLYNALGRTAGEVYSQPQQSGNLFENAITGFGDNIKNRARAIGNTMGTTFSAPVSAINDIRTNVDRDNMMGDNKARMDAVAKKYGYNSYQDVWDARDAAEAAGDTATLNKINNVINPELQAQATENSNKINDFAANYDDYRKNDYISQKINQDRGKYLGDSLTTLSTAADIAAMTTGMPMGLLANTVQGGVEGIANELSQNGLENFDWGRTGQNALIGAASGAATAGLNKVLPAAKQGGLLRNVASSTGRGALSGTVGGAVGGGLGAAMNNQDVLQGAVSGATQGAVSGGVSGATMGTVNALGNKIIGKGLERAQTRQLAGEDATLGDKAFNKIAEIQNTGKNWAESGENFNERLTNTLNSGDSAVGNWINGKQSKVLNTLGNVGNRIQDVNDQRVYNDTNNRSANIGDRQSIVDYLEADAEGIPQTAPAYRAGDAFNEAVSDLRQNYSDTELAQLLRTTNNGKVKSVINAALEQDSPTTLGGKQNKVSDFDAVAYNKQNAQIMSELEQNPNFQKLDAADKAMLKTAVLDGVGTIDKPRLDNAKTMNLERLNDNLESMKRWVFSGSLSDDKNANMAKYYDEYKNSPTTLGGWLKKAGNRAVEDINKTNLGNRIQDVSDDEPQSLKQRALNAVNSLKGRQPAYAGGTANATVIEGGAPDGGNLVKADYPLPSNASNKTIAQAIRNVIKSKFQGNSYNVGETGVKAAVNAKTVSEMGYQQPNMTDTDFNRKGSMAGNLDELLENMTDARRVANKKPEAKPNVDYYISGRVAVDLGDGEVYNPRVDVEVSGGKPVAYNISDIKKYPGSTPQGVPSGGDQPAVDYQGTYGRGTIIPQNEQNGNYSDDINNMFVNRNDMLDTAAEGPETELYRQLTGNSGDNGSTAQTPLTTANTGDSWDNLAREYGYNTYNDAIRAFAAANPNTPISAGAVTTWLDANEGNYNPNRVQTTQNATMPTEIQEAELVPSKTSRETKLKYAQGKELLAQYGAVDQPMARATKAPETFQKLAEMGFTKPGDVEKISNAITGSNGAVSKLTKSVIASAKPVNTFDGETAGQTMDDFINNSIEHNMLSGTNQGKAVKRGIDAYLRSLPSHADGSITMEDSAADAFKVVQGLEARAAELEGRGGSTYHRATTEDVHQAAVLKDVANLLKDRIYAGADVKAALTPEVAQELKAFDPKNATWAKTVDDFVSSAKTAQDLRSFQKPFVRANRYINNQYVQAATAGGRMAASAGELPAILPTTKAGIIKQVVNNVWNSNPAHRARAAAYGKLAENAAANAPQTTTTAQPAVSNPQTAVYDLLNRNNTLNVIGRNIGEEMGRAAAPAQDYVDMAMNAEAGYVAPLAATTSTAGSLEDLANTGAMTTTTPTTLTDSLGGGTDSRFTGQFSNTGNDQVDLLGRAMELAMAADDADAFATLYGMYNNALSSLEKSSSDLTAAQQTQLAKFDSADDAINELEALYNQAGGGKGPVAGNLQSVAGDWGWDSGARTYNQMAEGLVNQIAQAIGKTDSLNTEGEVQRALKLVPSLTDDAQTAQNKLRTLREMLAQTKANYYGAYGV